MNYFNQESERLLYEPLTEKDIESWAEFFEDNPRVVFVGADPTRDKTVLAKEWIDRQLGRYVSHGLGHLKVIEKSSGQFAGMGGIIPRELNGAAEFEIGYSLKPRFWSKGYGTEIAKQMRKFGTENNVSKKFISMIHKENIPSMHVARKNSMAFLYDTEFLGMQVYVFGDR